MNRRLAACLATLVTAAAAAQQQPAPQAPQPAATTPPADNDTSLRKLSPDEIPPNLSFYAMDPLHKPGMPLGWASEEIRERLDRGLVAAAAGDDRVHLSWRLLESDPPDVSFNLYRSDAAGTETRLNARPIVTTTDFVDTAAAGGQYTWRVAALVNGRETGETAGRRTDTAIAAFKEIRLRDDVSSVDRVAIGDLDGDGHYDFVVKHPAGNIDPGRRVPSKNTYKIDGYNGRTGAFLWRIDLGWNINHGIWFSPMVVRDLDGDGKAEVCLRTAPPAATRDRAFDGGKGIVLEGPEY
ncbi:MAG: hypothetical protein ACRD1U_19240, partial [Vicinamibacterales bacterium]